MYTGKSMLVTAMPIDALEIDLPVSELNVQQKIDSIKTVGLVQPITVWLGSDANGFKPRIIDGFHRVEAAKRIGWTEVMCNQIDCSEEAFWDARIQSAKQHHEIEKDRLAAWICECWKHSNLADITDNVMEQLAITLWDMDAKRWSGGISDPRWAGWGIWGEKRLPQEEAPRRIFEWMDAHAIKWGTRLEAIVTAILGKYIPMEDSPYNNIQQSAIIVAHEKGLGLAETQKLIAKVAGTYSGRGKDHIDIYDVRKYFQEDREESLREFVDKQMAEERTKELEEQLLKARQAAEYAHTEEGRKTELRKVRYLITETYDQLMLRIKGYKDTLKMLPDGPDMLAEFSILARDTIAELWPSSRIDLWEVPAVLEENAKLRKELHTEHQLRIQAEAQLLKGRERQLKLSEKIKNVIAWPSQE